MLSAEQRVLSAGGVSAASMLVSATSTNAILGGQQLAQAADVGGASVTDICMHEPLRLIQVHTGRDAEQYNMQHHSCCSAPKPNLFLGSSDNDAFQLVVG